jgi:hypothetical protein
VLFKIKFSRFHRSIVFQRYDFIELNFVSILRAKNSNLKNCYCFLKKDISELQTNKLVDSITKLCKHYIKMIVILEDFPKLIDEL